MSFMSPYYANKIGIEYKSPPKVSQGAVTSPVVPSRMPAVPNAAAGRVIPGWPSPPYSGPGQSMNGRSASASVIAPGGSMMPVAQPGPAGKYWSPGALNNAPVAYPSPAAMYGGGGGGGGMQSWTGTFVPRADQMGVNTGFFPGDHARDALEKQAFLDEQMRSHQGPPGFKSYPEMRAYQQRAQQGGGGGGGGAADSWQGAMNSANQANEARYQDVLGGYQSRYERGMDLLSGAGAQETKDINKRYDDKLAQVNADLIARGMGNSSVKSSMALGVERERNAELARMQDRLRQQQLGVDTGLSGDTLQFMERKTENGPDLNLLAQLMSRYGAGGGGGGGGGGFGGVDFVSPSGLGFQNPMMWAQQAMMGGQGSIPMMGSGGRGFESSQERYERQTGRPWESRLSDQLVFGRG